MRSFGDLVREPADEVRVGFYTDPDGGASASCGSYGDLAATKAFIDKCRAAFRSPDTPMTTTAAP